MEHAVECVLEWALRSNGNPCLKNETWGTHFALIEACTGRREAMNRVSPSDFF